VHPTTPLTGHCSATTATTSKPNTHAGPATNERPGRKTHSPGGRGFSSQSRTRKAAPPSPRVRNLRFS
jgi:hypothetical protein